MAITKQQLRKVLKDRINKLSQVQKEKESNIIVNAIKQHPAYSRAKTIATYYPTSNEVDLRELHKIHPDKHFFYPHYHNATYHLARTGHPPQFKTGPFNLQEPINIIETLSAKQAKQQINLWLVPGLGFDQNNNRLGKGKGVYDQFLANAKGITLGICFQTQKVNSIPTDPWDIPMNSIMMSGSSL